MLSLRETKFVPKILMCMCVFVKKNGSATSYCEQRLETKRWDFTPVKLCSLNAGGLPHEQAFEMLRTRPQERPL